MMRLRLRLRLRLPQLLLLLLLLPSAEACSVPVFAYALRRWEPELHTLATSRDEAWRQALTRQAEASCLNLAVEAGEGADRLSHRKRINWWQGPLDARHQGTLGMSPVRQELVRRLAAGGTAVWLFVPGGDVAADAAARTMLEERLAYLKTVTELPPADSDDDTAATTLALAGPAVRLDFSILDVARDDAAEWVLMAQILAMAKETRGPCAVPVFGRARALIMLHGDSLSPPSIDDTVRFLTGACSCQVKELNPGWDLLVACDWEAVLAAATGAAAVPTPVVPETVVITPHAVADPAQGPPATTESRWWVAIAVFLGSAVLAWLWAWRWSVAMRRK